jgi:hypothetical protein
VISRSARTTEQKNDEIKSFFREKFVITQAAGLGAFARFFSFFIDNVCPAIAEPFSPCALPALTGGG